MRMAKLPSKQAKKGFFAPFKTNTWFVDCGNREGSEEVGNHVLANADVGIGRVVGLSPVISPIAS